LTELNYTQMTPIYNKYRERGFEILAFPCNQFGAQEPGSMEEILKFAKGYGAEFPFFAKILCNGPQAEPLYQYLRAKQTGTIGSSIKWNFTKFLVSRTGEVVSRHGPPTPPNDLIGEIESLLAAPMPLASSASTSTATASLATSSASVA
jgi:glutathione peroxidase